MNVRDAAQRLGVCERTIWRWLASGRLKSTLIPLERSNARREITIDQLLEAERRYRRDEHNDPYPHTRQQGRLPK